MSYRLSSADMIVSPGNRRSDWQRVQLPARLGSGYIDRLKLDDGLTLAYSSYLPSQDLLEDCAVDRDSRYLTIAIALEGRSVFQEHQGRRFEFLAGRTTVAAFSRARGERRHLAHERVRQLRLLVERPVLEKYALGDLLHDPLNTGAARQLSCQPSSHAIQRQADRLIHLHGHAGKRLDMQIAALTILSEQSRLLVPPATPARELRAEDEAKILQARDIMNRRYAEALTIPYLSTLVGINECKLKQGFRSLFSTSPHRLLTEIRMHRARELLEQGEQVSRVAYMVGFQHLSSFSAAFQRHYQCAPKSVRGQLQR